MRSDERHLLRLETAIGLVAGLLADALQALAHQQGGIEPLVPAAGQTRIRISRQVLRRGDVGLGFSVAQGECGLAHHLVGDETYGAFRC